MLIDKKWKDLSISRRAEILRYENYGEFREKYKRNLQ